MKSKNVFFLSTGLVIAGVAIGFCFHKDHTITQFVAVPVKVPMVVSTPAAPAQSAAPAPQAVATLAETPTAAAPVPAAAVSGAPSSQKTVSAYIAQPGDTLSNVAAALLGSDSKANRDIVINAIPSLQTNPDLIIPGREYRLPAPRTVTAPEGASSSSTHESPAVADTATRTPTPVAAADSTTDQGKADPSASVLKYTAKEGDTVTQLASALLGSDSPENREKIVSANPSLKADPDRVIAGKTYKIPAPEGGLAAAPLTPVQPAVRPAVQPDADQLVKDEKTRMLRYTAKTGDTLSSLAEALLGSDTESNRNLIINANPSLKANPDRVIEGATYLIPAPTPVLTQAQ